MKTFTNKFGGTAAILGEGRRENYARVLLLRFPSRNGAEPFYEYGTEDEINSVFGVPVEQCGTLEEVAAQLGREIKETAVPMCYLEFQTALEAEQAAKMPAMTPAMFTALYAPEGGKKAQAEAFMRDMWTALQAAMQHANDDDGGTCNFDNPALDYKAEGMKRAQAESIIKAAGFGCFEWRLFGAKSLVITGFTHGQGNRRSHMAEAFEQSMKASSHHMMMYYQMD